MTSRNQIPRFWRDSTGFFAPRVRFEPKISMARPFFSNKEPFSAILATFSAVFTHDRNGSSQMSVLVLNSPHLLQKRTLFAVKPSMLLCCYGPSDRDRAKQLKDRIREEFK